MEKLVELTLPPFAWLHDEALDGRNVILHVRSASIVEILLDGKHVLKPGVIFKRFVYINRYGFDEHMVAALHYSPLTDVDTIMQEIIDPAIEYYMANCDKMDEQSEMDELSEYN